MIGQIPLSRRKTAPKHKFQPSKSGGGITIANNGPSGVMSSLAQTTDDDSMPEKVSVLHPTEYKNKADTNWPNTRTTWYAQE